MDLELSYIYIYIYIYIYTAGDVWSWFVCSPCLKSLHVGCKTIFPYDGSGLLRIATTDNSNLIAMVSDLK